MSEPNWLTLEMLLDAHAEQLVIFGGPEGVRDRGSLESALDRPGNKHACGDSDLPSLAAAYAFGIARNQPFVDGNKCAAFVSIIMFLAINDIEFLAPEAEATIIILDLVAGEVSEEGLARWIRDNGPA